MNIFRQAGPAARLLLTALLLSLTAFCHAGLTDIATAPLATSPATSVLPNVLFVLDDSASMDNDSLPDWANDQYCRRTNGSYTGPCCRDSTGADGSVRNGPCWRDVTPGGDTPRFGTWRGAPPYLASDFNSLYYNPALTYAPPVNGDGSRKPNQTNFTSVATDAYGLQNALPINLLTQFPDSEWCTDNSYKDCLTNGNYLLPGSVNSKNYTTYHATTASGTRKVVNGTPGAPVIDSGRATGPHYYTILPGEYCDNMNLRNCQGARSAGFSFPAPLRWCSSTASASASTPAAGTCQAVKTPVYEYPRYPPMFAAPGAPAGSGTFVRTDIVPGKTSEP
jgi:type IV pilus assembly protein PilY1